MLKLVMLRIVEWHDSNDVVSDMDEYHQPIAIGMWRRGSVRGS